MDMSKAEVYLTFKLKIKFKSNQLFWTLFLLLTTQTLQNHFLSILLLDKHIIGIQIDTENKIVNYTDSFRIIYSKLSHGKKLSLYVLKFCY